MRNATSQSVPTNGAPFCVPRKNGPAPIDFSRSVLLRAPAVVVAVIIIVVVIIIISGGAALRHVVSAEFFACDRRPTVSRDRR